MARISLRPGALVLLLILSSCSGSVPGETAARDEAAAPACDADNGGITLPEGFCAVVVADNVGHVRHIAVDAQGDVYAAMRDLEKGGGIAALRDADGDGRAEQIRYFGQVPGTGIDLRDGYLYFGPDTAVVRYRLADGALLPEGRPEVVVGGLPAVNNSHVAKPFTFDAAGNLYVTIGVPSNSCQEEDRTPGSPASDPCDLLDWAGGIWRFEADRAGQRFSEDQRYATGIRNAVALDWNAATNRLHAVQHGRDMLNVLFPELYTVQENAETPAEQFFEVQQGDNFGWPYCYYDGKLNRKVLAPEYGGDGEEIGRCAQYENPIETFPAHWAPNDLLFYDGEAFPARYRNGAFVAFHGSWNRAPLPQAGYKVAFVPFDGAEPAGDYEIFADGFKGTDVLENPSDAQYRPMGLAVGPDGSLYIADSQQGRIWRVMWKG